MLQDGRIRLERYGLGYDSTKRWTSQSVSKSITSTLVGAALKDGYIKSLDDPVTRYIAGLRGSAYDSVTVRQLLTMTSGVRWTEVYTDTTSDVWRFYAERAPPGMTRTVSYMRKLPREAPPGTKWVYNTGETHLLGVLVSEATKKPLVAVSLREDLGAVRDGARRGVGARSHRLRDGGLLPARRAARLRALRPVHPRRRTDRRNARSSPTAISRRRRARRSRRRFPGRGYGYQWWTFGGGRFAAVGIHGQMIHIDPARRLIIVMSSAWPDATSAARSDARVELIRRITGAVVRETR